MTATTATPSTPRPTTPTGFNDMLIEDFRAHRGRVSSGPFVNSDLLLLTTIGAQSGRPRTSPLVYHRDGEHLIIVASKGGAPTNPAWYVNLLANPEVTVEVGDETFVAHARPATPESERRRLYDDHAQRYPGFREYEQRTTRVIPVVILER